MNHEMLWTSSPTSWVILFAWGGMRASRALLPTSQPVAEAGVPLLVSKLEVAALSSFHDGKKSTIIIRRCYLLSHSIKSVWLSGSPVRKALG